MRCAAGFVACFFLFSACGEDAPPDPDAAGAGADASAVDGAPVADATGADAAIPDAGADAIPADAAPTVSTFQQGVAAYSGTQDTTLLSANPDSSAFGSATVIAWEGGTFGLLRFAEIFGSSAGQVPAGATVLAASLTIEVNNASVAAGALHNALVTWNQATTTFNSLGAAPGVTAGADYDAAEVAAAPHELGIAVIDVTSSLQAWAASPGQNRGWVFVSASGDGVAAGSSEATSAAKPLLTVEWLPPR